jgi:uncharacterized membrane protein YwaF
MGLSLEEIVWLINLIGQYPGYTLSLISLLVLIIFGLILYIKTIKIERRNLDEQDLPRSNYTLH